MTFKDALLPIVGVLVATASLISTLLLLGRSLHAIEQSRRKARLLLLALATMYAVGLTCAVMDVFSGGAPAWSLMFAPIPLVLIWAYLRDARRMGNREPRRDHIN
jgi:hypothetical protein